MKVAILGLWHLGCVTAACLAKAGHEVVGIDPDQQRVSMLDKAKAPLFEPGLDELLAQGLQSGKLRFTTDCKQAVPEAQVLWVTFDTPVDEHDHADTGFVLGKIEECFPYLREGAVVLVSSQLPVGSTGSLQSRFRQSRQGGTVTHFCYSPENLRLGNAINVFSQPDRVVLGVSDESARKILTELFAPLTDRLEWMSPASAEMTKHAINAFLALSVVFINDLALLCEKVGADAKEVERGLKTEQRIGPKAYLKAGSAFAGGTLARDIVFLQEVSRRVRARDTLFRAVQASNEDHKAWPQRKISEVLPELKGRIIGVLGLAYKAGTSTLRRSAAVELCRWLHEQGAKVQAYDPLISTLPAEEGTFIKLCAEPAAVFQGAELVVLATEWPALKSLSLEKIITGGAIPVLIDPNGFFVAQALPQGMRYFRVGAPAPTKEEKL